MTLRLKYCVHVFSRAGVCLHTYVCWSLSNNMAGRTKQLRKSAPGIWTSALILSDCHAASWEKAHEIGTEQGKRLCAAWSKA